MVEDLSVLKRLKGIDWPHDEAPQEAPRPAVPRLLSSAHAASFDSQVMQQYGFKPKFELESFWTDQDLEQFRRGAAEVVAGTRDRAGLDAAYYMSHYVMQRRFSTRACTKQLLRMAGQLQRARAAPQREEGPVVLGGAVHSDDDSEDEVELARALV